MARRRWVRLQLARQVWKQPPQSDTDIGLDQVFSVTIAVGSDAFQIGGSGVLPRPLNMGNNVRPVNDDGPDVGSTWWVLFSLNDRRLGRHGPLSPYGR